MENAAQIKVEKTASNAKLRKAARGSFDTSTYQGEAYRKMLVQHAALTPDVAVLDARFELNPYIEEYKTQTRYRKQGTLVNMAAQVKILKEQQQNEVMNRNVFDKNKPIKRHRVAYPDVAPSYYYNPDSFLPRTDAGHINFGQQLSPRRSDVYSTI